MISLTSTEIGIVKSDSAVKNFRVHFPNGEHTDLTNDDVIFESVKFTESVCSEESFRFGCAEASVIEFETVGVPNIIGLMIECQMEFTKGMTTVVIPYGLFIVDSCPRDHQSMTHRKITAYSRRYINAYLPAFEQWKMSRKCTNGFYYMNPFYFLTEVGLTNPTTESAISGTAGSMSYRAYSNIEDGQTVLRRVSAYYPAGQYYEYTITDFDAVYRIDMTGSLSALYAILEAHGMSLTSPVVTATLSIMSSGGTEADRYHIPLTDNGDGTISAELIYPECPQIKSSDTVKIKVPLKIEVQYVDTSAHQHDWSDTATVATACSVTKLTASGSEAGITLAFEHTLESSSWNYFYNAYSGADIISAYAELIGAMVRTNRDGSLELVYLDDSSPYDLTASDVVGSAWWDEYIVGTIGTVTYDFTDKNGNQYTNEYEVDSDGISIYDMSGNYIFNHMKDATGSKIETLLHDLFKPRAEDVTFTPLDADFAGMPFLQCGDAIRLTAADGTVVNSYILEQTFSGIQMITQDVNTVQGEVLSNDS